MSSVLNITSIKRQDATSRPVVSFIRLHKKSPGCDAGPGYQGYLSCCYLAVFIALMFEENTGVAELGQGKFGISHQFTYLDGTVTALAGIARGDPGPNRGFDALGGAIDIIDPGARRNRSQVITEIVRGGAGAVFQAAVGYEIDLRWRFRTANR